MANPFFITINQLQSSGVLGALVRTFVLVTREAVAGFDADTKTGLYKINSTDLAAFEAANQDSFGLRNALEVIFNQQPTFNYVYILSVPSGVQAADLTKANRNSRAWAFLSLVSQYQGGGTGGSDVTPYLADLAVMATWATPTKNKIVVHTYSLEDAGSIPATLQLNGDINKNANVKTIISNSQHELTPGSPSFTIAYDNVALAWVTFCIKSAISRGWGSLSDAHDFAYVMEDTYSDTFRSEIENNSLAQYNGAKDKAGSLFVYDTQMNDKNNPPQSMLIESLVAQYYVADKLYVDTHNALQAAGQDGLSNDDLGIQRLRGLAEQSMKDSFSLNLISAKSNGTPDFQISALTAAGVTAAAPNWQVTGIWPSGVISITFRPFGSAKYVTLDLIDLL